MKELKTPVFIGVIVVVVVVVGYLLLKTAGGPPEPTIPPGQTIQNPLGANAPSGPPGGPQGMPAPGTAIPGRGMGPSRNAPIPKK